MGESVELDSITLVNVSSSAAERRQKFTAVPLVGEATVKLVWLPMNRSSVCLCWSVEFISRSTMEGFRVLVDARSGETVIRQNRTCWYTSASYRVFNSDSPSPFTPGHAVPSSTQPAIVARQLLTLPALSQTASPEGWIPDGSNQTIGNNVDASVNWNAQTPNPTPRPQGSPARVFDLTLDLGQAPDTYGNASAVNLFY